MTGKDDTTQHMAASAPAGAAETTCRQPAQPPRGKRQANGHAYTTEQMSLRQVQDGEAARGVLDRTLQAQLGRQLRSIYADVASEPVPERFIKLLQELEAKEKRQ